MAVMSFAHLKNKTKQPEKQKHQESPQNTPSTIHSGYNAGVGAGSKKVLSFAFLKDKKSVPVVPVHKDKAPEKIHEEPKPERKLFSIPAVMPTARLQAVNYCTGCGRFLPATEGEKLNGNPYGRCYRLVVADARSGVEQEVWKVIPKTAEVKRCYFAINQE